MGKASKVEEPFRPFFQFYPRYYEPLQLLPVEDRGAVYDAIIGALLYDKWPEVESFSVSQQIVWRTLEHGFRTSVTNHRNGKQNQPKGQAIDKETGEVVTAPASSDDASDTTSERASERASDCKANNDDREKKPAPPVGYTQSEACAPGDIDPELGF